tara:strand:+ start:58 stop:603 length:546 start_codon:yes stop_codon:yes gene_type:complete
MSICCINKLIKHHFNLIVEEHKDPNTYNEDFGIDPYNWDTLEDYANGDIEMMLNEYPWNYVSCLTSEVLDRCTIYTTLDILQCISNYYEDPNIDFELIHHIPDELIYKYIYVLVKEKWWDDHIYDIKIIFDLNKEKLEKEDVLNFKYIVSPKKKLPNDIDNIIISYLAPSHNEIVNNNNYR